MKKYIVIIILTLTGVLSLSAQQQLPVKFDERCDLMSLIWRMSGANEYNMCDITQYSEAADFYFKPYIDHPVIILAKEYAQRNINYDAVVSFALHLKIASDGTISLDSNFKEGGDSSFDRWTEKQRLDFLSPLSDFYRTTQFHQWYEQTIDYREKAITSFQKEIGSNIDIEWFDRFFGPQLLASYHVVLSLFVGPGNYGCSALMQDGTLQMSPVIGCASPDSTGYPCYTQQDVIIPIVIHEFCHAYCNPLNAKFWSDMKKNALKIYSLNDDNLRKMAYGTPETMMNETFVRSSVIHYIIEHYTKIEVSKLIQSEKQFYLTESFVNTLDEYTRSRDQYATMEAFMPNIVAAVNQFDIHKVRAEQRKSRFNNARIVNCNIRDGAKNIPAGKTTLTITFSKPMAGGLALGKGKSDGLNINLAGTFEESVSWSEDKKTISILLHLEPAQHYSFSILGGYFKTQDGHNAGKTMYIDFWTKENL